MVERPQADKVENSFDEAISEIKAAPAATAALNLLPKPHPSAARS